ncbi:MAG: cupin domain-containing protein, partial [Sporichthyaceae bacterium]
HADELLGVVAGPERREVEAHPAMVARRGPAVRPSSIPRLRGMATRRPDPAPSAATALGDQDREPARAGDVVYTPRGSWHGFGNTGDEDVLLIWGWSGAGNLEQAGYAIPDHGHEPGMGHEG